MNRCANCDAILPQNAVFCAQCAYPVEGGEGSQTQVDRLAVAEEGATAADPSPNPQPSPGDKPPPITPPSPLRQFALGLGITAAVLAFLPLDGLFDTADGPYATEPSSTRAPAQPQAPARRETPPPPVQPPSDEEPPPAQAPKAPAAPTAPKPSPATTEGFKVPSFPPSKAQVPPSQKPAARPDRRPQIRKALRQLLNNLLEQGESMESLRGDPTKLGACERASSVAQAQAKGLQRTAAQFESVGFLSSATQRVGKCVSCAEDALDHCKEVEDLLRLEAQGHE